MSITIGKKAPDFKLSDEAGKIHSLKDYLGKIVVLYFYPRDLTPGCTIEAEGYRDAMKELKKLGVVVFGVSADSPKSHKKFRDKLKLNFPLLADEKKETIKKYGAWVEKSMYGKKYMGISRDTFIIDQKGILVRHDVKVTPETHPKEILTEVKKLLKK